MKKNYSNTQFPKTTAAARRATAVMPVITGEGKGNAEGSKKNEIKEEFYNEMKMNYKKYGRFSKDAREFIVNNPDTPRPWINYLTNGRYCALVSHTGAGYSFFKDFRSDRILRWNQANMHIDRPGRYIFIKDRDSGKAWSATWQPIRARYSKFECRHSLGYTRVFQSVGKIETQLTYFVPENDSLELWIGKIKKKGQNVNSSCSPALLFEEIG